MTPKRIIGIVLLILAAVPALFAGTMLVGISQSMLRGWFTPQKAHKLAGHLPESIQRVLDAAKNPNQVQDPRVRQWAESLTKVKPGPVALARKLGVFDWADAQLVRTFSDISDALRGHKDLSTLVVDLRPLRKALLSPEVTQYVTKVLNSMPPCDYGEMARWRYALAHPKRASWPGCTPGGQDTKLAVQAIQAKFKALPDQHELPLQEGTGRMHVPTNALTALSWVSWAVLGAGILLVLLGGFLAGQSLKGRLVWTGLGTLVGGLPALMTGLAVRGAFSMATHPSEWHLEHSDPFWRTALGRIVLQETGWYARTMFGDLFSTLTTVALVVCGIGLVVALAALVVPKSVGRNEQ